MKMGNKNKYLFWLSFVVFMVLPIAGFTQTDIIGGDTVLKEYFFPISSYKEVGEPEKRSAVECDTFRQYYGGEDFIDANSNYIFDQGEIFSDFGFDRLEATGDAGEGNAQYDTSFACQDLAAYNQPGNIKKGVNISSVYTTGTASLSYKFIPKENGNYVFKIGVSNLGDNFAALERQQLDYIFEQYATGYDWYDQSSYIIDEDKRIALLEYFEDNGWVGGDDKYALFKNQVYSVFVNGETSGERKGFIVMPNTDQSKVQIGSLIIGNLIAGEEYTVYLHFLSDFYFNFYDSWNEGYCLSGPNKNLACQQDDPTTCPDEVVVHEITTPTGTVITEDILVKGNCVSTLYSYLKEFKNADLDGNKRLDTNPVIYSVELNKIDPTADLVGIRVYSNNEHKDPYTWYKESVVRPSETVEQLLVDGYQGVKDGRTVYANAANITNQGGFYTNMYVIAYNQSASDASINIYNQMLANFVFNQNVISKDPINAEINKDKLRRDVVRLADLFNLEKLLQNYKAVNGKFPTLQAGTYVSNNTISTWPSWQANLGNQLGTQVPVDPLNIMATSVLDPTTGQRMTPKLSTPYNCLDPIVNQQGLCAGDTCLSDGLGNALTGCPANQQCVGNDYCSLCPKGFDSLTCWDDRKLQFAYGKNAGCDEVIRINNTFKIGGTLCQHDGAFVYQYAAKDDGSDYSLNYHLEYEDPDICAPGQCYFDNNDGNPGNDCYGAGQCLYDTNGDGIPDNTDLRNIYCFLGAWKQSCGDGFVESTCGEQCDPNAPAKPGTSWCDINYGSQDWYRETDIQGSCTNQCVLQEFGQLSYTPERYTANVTDTDCGGYCGDFISQYEYGETCDEGPLPAALKGPEAGQAQTSQYMCSGKTSGQVAANCNSFAYYDTTTLAMSDYAPCTDLTIYGPISRLANDFIKSEHGFQVSYDFDVRQAGNYTFQLNTSNEKDNISNLTDEQIDFLYTLKNDQSRPISGYLWALQSDGSLIIPEYGLVAAADPRRNSLLRSLVYAVYLDGEDPLNNFVGHIIVPATDSSLKQKATIEIPNLTVGPHTVYVHFVSDYFYLPIDEFPGLEAEFPGSLSSVDLGDPADKKLDINPVLYNISLFSTQLGVTFGNCQTYGGWCGDGSVQIDFGEQCDKRNYITPSPAETVNIVVNPGFEAVFSPWQNENGTLRLDKFNYYFGGGSLSINSDQTVNLSQNNVLFANKAYKISLRIKNPVSSTSGKVDSVDFTGGDQSAVDWFPPLSFGPAIENQAGWQLFEIPNFTATNNIYKIKLTFNISGGATTFYLDDIRIIPLDSASRPQYLCGTDTISKKICQYRGGYCGDGDIQVGFGENCDDRVGLACNTNEECGKSGKCNATTNVCESVRCNESCGSTYCGDGIVQTPNSSGVYEVCDYGSDPYCSLDCKHIKMAGSCDKDNSGPCLSADGLDCRECVAGLSCTIRNFGDVDKKCLGTRNSYGCTKNADCILGHYCDIGTSKCEPEISTYLQYHPEDKTILNLPAPSSAPYDINISFCPDLRLISSGQDNQYFLDRCTGVSWLDTDNMAKNNWTYLEAINDGCGGVSRLPKALELYSLVSQTKEDLIYADKAELRLCPVKCGYDETGSDPDLCIDCIDDNYLYWSSTCSAYSCQGGARAGQDCRSNLECAGATCGGPCQRALAVNFKYGSIEDLATSSGLKIRCLKDTECGNGLLEEGETCEFFKAYTCDNSGQACGSDMDCADGGICLTNLVEQKINNKCTNFGYDGGYLHCDRVSCNYRYENCYLNSQVNQTCQDTCKGRKALDCRSVGTNIEQVDEIYSINAPAESLIANNNLLINVDSAGNCQAAALPGADATAICSYRFIDRQKSCVDTLTGQNSQFGSEYSFCNCQENIDVGIGGGNVTVNLPPPPPNVPPTVSITAPANGATFAAPANIAIDANASDSDGTIAKVEFYQGTTLLGEATSSPYSFSWSGVTAGSYSLTAKATDNENAPTTSSAISITVGAANVPPTVSITAPANGATFAAPANIAIDANASDSDGTIAKVEFYQGTTLLGEDTSSPYSFSWSGVTAGSYSLTAKATDNENAPTTSSAISITVAASSAKAITSFVFPGIIPQTISINPADHTIAITVPSGTNVTALMPTIDITGVSVSPDSSTARNFTSPVTYTVTAADATTQAWVVTVMVEAPAFSCTGTTPTNATLCSGDDTELTVDTAKTAVNFCTTFNKCQHQCNSTYVYDSGSNTCVQGKLVWQSGGLWDGNLGGVAGADAKCQAEATNWGYRDPTTNFKAWISTATAGPQTTFTHSTAIDARPYYLVSGIKVAASWADLTDGSLLHEPNGLGNGSGSGSANVWTNTTPAGTPYHASNSAVCGNWTSSSGTGLYGLTQSKTATWTLSSDLSCASSARLYCFGQQ